METFMILPSTTKPGCVMEGSTTVKLNLTREEARKWIKSAKAGVHFNAHVSMDQAIKDSEDEHYPSGARLTVPLSRAAALDMVKQYLSDRSEEDGRRIPCSVYRSGNYVAYWIG
jgi:hypothetical protein